MRILLIVVLFLVAFAANTSANHFLGVHQDKGFGGHEANCKDSMQGPYRGMGEAFHKRPFTALFFLSSAVSYSSVYVFSTTSECVDDAVTWHKMQQFEFVAVGHETLLVQIARGGGEHLRVLTSLMGCPAEDYPQIAKLAQERFPAVWPDERATAEELLRNLRRELAAVPDISGRCNWLV